MAQLKKTKTSAGIFSVALVSEHRSLSRGGGTEWAMWGLSLVEDETHLKHATSAHFSMSSIMLDKISMQNPMFPSWRRNEYIFFRVSKKAWRKGEVVDELSTGHSASRSRHILYHLPSRGWDKLLGVTGSMHQPIIRSNARLKWGKKIFLWVVARLRIASTSFGRISGVSVESTTLRKCWMTNSRIEGGIDFAWGTVNILYRERRCVVGGLSWRVETFPLYSSITPPHSILPRDNIWLQSGYQNSE